MSTVAIVSLEECSASTEDNVELNKTGKDNVEVSICSDVSHSRVKAYTDSFSSECGLHEKQLENLQADEKCRKVADLDKIDTLKPAPRSRVTVPDAVRSNKDGSEQAKPKLLNSDRRDNEADDLTKLATENFVVADSCHGSGLSTCPVIIVSEESATYNADAEEVRVSKDMMSVSGSSVRSLKSHMRGKKIKDVTDKQEASSRTASSVSVRAAKSPEVTAGGVNEDIAASRTSLQSQKARAVNTEAKSQTDRSEAESPAPMVSVRSSESQEVDKDITKSAASLALSHYSENEESQKFVRQSANASASHDMPADNGTLGSRSSVRSSVNSEASSNSSSVVISKPPKHVVVNKAVKDTQPAAEAKNSKTGCVSGDSVSVLL